MSPEAFRAFTEAVRVRVAADARVRGLVALGSTAEIRAPDPYSDHDLWLIVAPGTQESFRGDLSWLPGPERHAFAFRETEHGVKVVYEDAHLVEAAVFSLEELELARANHYRVLLGDESVAHAVAATAERGRMSSPADPSWLFGQALTHLLVGVARHRRGEGLSGHRFVHGMAVERLVALIHGLETPENPQAADDLDPFRRFESLHPARAEALHAALGEPLEGAVSGLLDLLEAVAGSTAERGRALSTVRALLRKERSGC